MPEFDANPATVASPAYLTNTMDVGRMDSTAQGVIADLQRDNRAPVFPQSEKTGADAFAASWRTGTSIGALASSQFLREMMHPTSDSPSMTASEAYDRAVNEGLQRHAAKIAPYAFTEALYNSMAEDARREDADNQTIAASGKMGHAIGLAAGMTDPVNFIPVAGVAARAAKAGSLANTALKAGEAGLVATAAQEGIIQGVSSTRTPAESVMNVATGTLFSAVLGGALHKMIGPDNAAKFEKTQDKAVDGAAVQKEVADNLAVTRETTGVPERDINSAGAGSVLTREQQAEVRAIQKDYPDMDRNDIVDSILAKQGDLSFTKLRPGLSSVEEGKPSLALTAEDLTGAFAQNSPWVRTGGKQNRAPQDVLQENLDAHLEGKVSYGDIAKKLNEEFAGQGFDKFTRDSVSGAIRRLRDKGMVSNTSAVYTRLAQEVHTTQKPSPADQIVKWLKDVGIEDVKIDKRGDTQYLTFKDEGTVNAMSRHGLTEVRIPADGHSGRPARGNEAGGARLDMGDQVGNIGKQPHPEVSFNAAGEPFSDLPALLDALKWRLSKSPDGNFLVSPGREPLPRARPELATDFSNSEKNPFQRSFQLNQPKGTKPRSVGAEVTTQQPLNGTNRLDARFLGLPLDQMLKNANKAFTTAPLRGAAGITATGAEWLGLPAKTLRKFADNPVGNNIVQQGMRNLRLNMQDSPFPAAREYIKRADINNPYYMKTDQAGFVTQDSILQHYRPLKAAQTEATRVAEETWRKHRGELTNEDGSRMSHDDYAAQVSIANISDGKHDNPIIEKAAKGFRNFFDAVQQKLVDVKLLEPDKKVRNAESYGPINYLPDAVRNDREHFIAKHAEDFGNKFEQDYAQAAGERQAFNLQKAGERTKIHITRNEGAQKVGEELKAKVQDLQAELGEKHATLKETFDTKLADLRQKRSDTLAAVKGDGAATFRETRKFDNDIQELRTNHDRDFQDLNKEYAGRELKSNTTATIMVPRKNGLALEGDGKSKSSVLAKEHNAAIADLDKERADALQKIRDLEPEYNQNILKLTTPEKRAAKAKELGEHLYESVTNNPSGVLVDSDIPHFRGFGQVLKARSTETAQRYQAKAGWIDMNIFRQSEAYMRKTGTGAAMASVFQTSRRLPKDKITEGGPTHELVGDMGALSARNDLIEQADAMINAAAERGDTKSETALTKQKKQALVDMDTFHDMALGNHGGGENSINVGAIGPMIQHYNNVRFMGGTVIASLPDPFNVVASHGLANSMKYGFIPAMKEFKSTWLNVAAEEKPDIGRILQMTGAATEHVLNGRLAAMADLGSPTHNKALGYAELTSKTFWRFSGLAGWTNFIDEIMGRTTHGRLIEASQRGFDNLSVGEKTWLTNLKFEKADLERVAAMYDEQSAAGHGTSAGVPYGRTQDLSKEGRGDYTGWSDREIANKFDDAVYMESFRGAVKPTAGDKLALTATPMGRILWQYRNFGVAMSAQVMARNAALAGIDDAAKINFYTGVVGLVMAGVLVDMLKTIAGEATPGMTGSKNHPDMSSIDVWMKKWQTDPGAQMYHALDRSSVLWPITEASNVMKTMGLPNIEQGIGKVLGDKSEENPGRFSQRSVVDAALGPSAGLLTDVPGLFKDVAGGIGYATGFNPNWNYTKQQFGRDRRLSLLQNTVPAQQLFNYGHKYLGTIWGWPEPK